MWCVVVLEEYRIKWAGFCPLHNEWLSESSLRHDGAHREMALAKAKGVRLPARVL